MNLIQVLLIEDSPDAARLIHKLLQAVQNTPFNIEHVERLATGLERLRANPIDAVLLDLTLPDSMGLETLNRVCAHVPNLPIVVLTSLDDEAIAIEAVRQGAQDYLIKGQADGELLARALRYAIERKRAEEALAKSEARYRSLVETAGAGIATIDLDGNLVFVNQALCNMAGYTEEELLGKPFASFLHPDDVERAARLFLNAFQDPVGRVELEFRAIHKDGHTIYCYSTPTILWQQGEIARFNAIIQDITARKQAEEALRESEERYRTLFETAPVIIYAISTDGRFTALNPAFEKVTGWSRDEWLGRPFAEIIHPDDLAFAAQQFQRVLQGAGEGAYSEMRILSKAGAVLTMEIVGIQQVMDGRVVGTSGFARDITERKRAEEVLARERNLLRTLIDNVPYSIYVKDTESRFVMGNLEVTRHLGAAAPEEIIGKNDFDFFPKDLAKQYYADEQQVLRSGQPLINREEIVEDQTTGKRLWNLATKVPLRNSEGNSMGLVGIGRVITVRKRAEEMIQRRSEELAALNRIGQALSRLTPPSEIVELLYANIGQVLDNRNLYIALYDEAKQSIAFPAYTINGERHTPASRPFGNGLTEYVIRTKAPLLIPHNQSTFLTEQGIDLLGTPSKCFLAVPMRVGERVIGVIAVQDYERENVYDVHHLELLDTLAAQAAIALENARLYGAVQQELDVRKRVEEQVRRHAEQLTALHAVDVAINSSLDLRLTLDILLNQVVSQLKVDAAAVLLFSPHTQTLEYAVGRGFRSTAIQQTRERLGEGHAGRAALERRLISIPHASPEAVCARVQSLLARERFVAHHVAPLIAKGQVKGVLELFHRAPFVPEAEWLEFLETLGGQAAIAIDNAELFERLQRSNAELTMSYDATLEGWSRALDLRDKETEGHSQRVTEMTLRLARALGMSEQELVHVRRGALLHDVGKLGVPDAILLKPGPLTDDEWKIMRCHPAYAYTLLLPIGYLRPALDIPYRHHERWDGTGYPHGLKGEQIPLAARIFAVVDVWDAMRSDRPYRSAWSDDKVREHIHTGAGTHFDPKVVEVFLKTHT